MKREENDVIIFEESLRELHKSLLEDYIYDGYSIIIAMSRKGPKLIDAIFSEDELQKLNIVTEFALPFIFQTFDKNRSYRVFIVDDAIYYGSTLKNLIKDIRAYEDIYNLNFILKAYVAIQDKGSITFNNIIIKGKNDIRDGYGHFFVKQVMALFRQKKQCFEVEFPVVTFFFDKIVDLNKFYNGLKDIFNQTYQNVYKEEIVVNALLPKTDSQFNKIRVYSEDKKLHLAFIAPFNISSNKDNLEHLFDNMDKAYKDFWTSIYNHLFRQIEKKKISDILLRNMEKSLIVIANYIYSYQFFILYQLNFENLIKSQGIIINSYGIERMSLYRLIGNQKLTDDLYKLLHNFTQRKIYSFPKWVNNSIDTNYQVYEEYNRPTIEDRKTLESYNEHMIRNCRTYDEALSAIVFNQNLFVERWYRYDIQSEDRHLWFGYTHEMLQQQLKNYSYIKKPISEIKVHKWLDSRIDMGCVVPQYIIDNLSGQWVRVFRPGENEEFVLSHLARYVIHIYKLIDQRLNLGFIPLFILDSILVILHKQLWDKYLSQQFLFCLNVVNKQVVLTETEYEGNPLPIVTYLINMYVLEQNADEITIAPRISDPDFLSNTTLDNISLNLIEKTITSLMDKFKEYNIKYYSCESFFNYFLNDDVKPSFILQFSKDTGKQLLDIVNKISIDIYYFRDKLIDKQNENNLYNCYDNIMKYDVSPNFYINQNNVGDLYEYSIFIKSQNNFKKLLLIINLLMGIYLIDDFDVVMSYLHNKNTLETMNSFKLDNLKKYVLEIDSTNINKVRKDATFLSILKSILNKIIYDN